MFTVKSYVANDKSRKNKEKYDTLCAVSRDPPKDMATHRSGIHMKNKHHSGRKQSHQVQVD